MSKILKNTTASAINITDTGITLAALSDYTIPPQDYLIWAASSDILSPVGVGDVIVNDGSENLDPSTGIDLLKGIVSADFVSDPSISVLTAVLADTEYSFMIPAGTREFTISSRGLATVKIAFSTGQLSTNYVTIPPGYVYERSKLRRFGSLTLYVSASKSGEQLEIHSWS